MAAYLCWAGWFEKYGIMLSVKEGFLYMEIFQLVGVLWIVTSRKFSLLLVSVSAVKVMFGWIVLKSFCMLFLHRIKDEIKFLHCKKQKLNLVIYHLHLHLAKSWGSLWPHMHHIIKEKLKKECRAKYQTLDNKLKCLSLQQTATPPSNPSNFHHRVVNMTDISFTEPEMALLQKGPKYNLHDKPKNWIRNLALEAETAISSLPPSQREIYRTLTSERINALQNNNKPSHTHTQHTLGFHGP